MALHLLPVLKSALTPELTAALASTGAASHAALHSTNDTWTALLLGVLAHRAAGDGGASAVRDLLASAALQRAAQASAAWAAAPGDDTMLALAEPGNSVLDALLGGARRGRVTLALAAVSGLSAQAAQHLAWTSSAMALNALSHALPAAVRSDDAALLALLRAQAPSLDRQLDARLTTAAGLGSPSALMAALQGAPRDAFAAAPAPRKTGAAGLPADRARRWTGAIGGAASAALGLVLVGWVASRLATADSHDRLAGTLPSAASAAGDGQHGAPGAASGAVSTAVSGAVSSEAAADSRIAVQVFFENGQSAVGDDGQRKITAVCQWLAADASRRVYLTGYTDASGDPAINMALAQQRAQAVFRALHDQGARADRIVMRPPESLTVTADMPAARARRVEIDGP